MTDRKEYLRQYQKEWMRKRRQDWLDLNGPCAHCGSDQNLEVDHINPATKTMQPAAIWSRRQEIRDAELAKCQVLCEECHKIKSKLQIDITQNAAKGEKHYKSKLTQIQVDEIRTRYKEENITHQKLANEYGVARTTVTEIINFHWWK